MTWMKLEYWTTRNARAAENRIKRKTMGNRAFCWLREEEQAMYGLRHLLMGSRSAKTIC